MTKYAVTLLLIALLAVWGGVALYSAYIGQPLAFVMGWLGALIVGWAVVDTSRTVEDVDGLHFGTVRRVTTTKARYGPGAPPPRTDQHIELGERVDTSRGTE